MKMKLLYFLISFVFVLPTEWQQKKEKGYILFYKPADQKHIDEYNSLIKNGMKEVKAFFSSGYQNEFAVCVHPDRHSLDSTWQHDWKMPEFRSECWMVASGVADRLDFISPQQWDSLSCEHRYSDKEGLQKLITHELVHVFHGQKNKSRDFSETENLDWFVEGLAAYASGQLDGKLNEVKQAIQDSAVPLSLNDFWKGKLRYPLSASAVMYIDKTFGRKKLFALLHFTRKSEVLSALLMNEEKFLADWKIFMLK
jgi:hypothetical protein